MGSLRQDDVEKCRAQSPQLKTRRSERERERTDLCQCLHGSPGKEPMTVGFPNLGIWMDERGYGDAHRLSGASPQALLNMGRSEGRLRQIKPSAATPVRCAEMVERAIQLPPQIVTRTTPLRRPNQLSDKYLSVCLLLLKIRCRIQKERKLPISRNPKHMALSVESLYGDGGTFCPECPMLHILAWHLRGPSRTAALHRLTSAIAGHF